MAIYVSATGKNINCVYVEEDYSDMDNDLQLDTCPWSVAAAAGFGFTSGLSWIACAVCSFVFSCGNRYKKYHLDDAHENREDSGYAMSPVISAYPIHSTNKDGGEPPSFCTVNKVATHLPDGSIKTVTETILPNGKKQVIITIEKPAKGDMEEEEEQSLQNHV
jgi:hypothetical protein